MRTDIQALRAMAVLMVIGNHLFLDRISGGYVGVDVFFVISGFLITAHLLREADSTGGIRLGAFWARRARRLLPAALLVLALCAVLVVLKAPLPAWDLNLTQIAVAAVYGLNWLLAGTSLDYFAQEDGHTLVTHYWSLSVEEQFYLIWPLIVLAVYVLARKKALRTRRIMVGTAFGVILIASFAWAVYSSAVIPEAAYFQTTGRAWEFAAGGLIAMLPAVSVAWRTRLIPVVWLAWAALAGTAVLLGPDAGVPGWAALVPVGATAIIIAVGESPRWFGTRYVTGFWPVKTIGDISYSAYLWHWPFIAAAPWFFDRTLTIAEKAVILIATLVLAWLSKRFVEDPVRTGRPASWRPRRALLAALAVMALVFVPTFGGALGMRAQAASAAEEVAAAVEDPPECFGVQAALTGADCPATHVIADSKLLLLSGDWQVRDAKSELDCDVIDVAGDTTNACSFGAADGTQRMDIALVGDSHALVWGPALERLAERHDARIHVYTKGWCSVTADPDVQFAERSDREMDACTGWRTAVIDAITASDDIDVVVTSARVSRYFSARGTGPLDDGSGYAQAWQQWLDSGKAVIAIADAPSYPGSVLRCTDDLTAPDPCVGAVSSIAEPNPLSRAAAAIDDPRFAYVDYSELFCDTICHSVVGGLPVSRDGNHLNSFLVLSFGDDFLRAELARVLP